MTEINEQKARSTQGIAAMGTDIQASMSIVIMRCQRRLLIMGTRSVRSATTSSNARTFSHLDDLTSEVGSSLDAAKERIVVAKEDIKVVSTAVLTAVSQV